jgi:hypothetical protein
MNEQLQKALAGNIELFTQWLKDSVNATGEFITRETPLFIQEYLTWCFWQAAITAVLTLLVALFLVGVLGCVWWSGRKWGEMDRYMSRVVAVVICVPIIASMLVCGVYQNGMTALKIKMAPRLVLVEKAAELVKDLTGTTNQPNGRR